MKPWAKLGYLAAACALLVTTFSIVGPRTVRAAVAALVQVSNTSANPVPVVSTQALQAFVQQCTLSTLPNISQGSCEIPVPAGEEVVVQTVSLFANTDPVNTQLEVRMQLPGEQEYARAEQLTPGASFRVTMTGTLYASPNTSIQCLAQTPDLNPTNGVTGECYVIGYYVTVP